MPLYVAHIKKPRRIHVTTPIEEYQLLCPPPVWQLDVLLNDYTNLLNHTFDWGQVRGEPVPITTIDVDTMEFPTTDRSDKTFRYYINKDTNREEFVDITVYFTPTSKMPRTTKNVLKEYRTHTIPNLSYAPSFIAPSVDGTIQTDFDIETGTRLTFDATAIPKLVGTLAKMELLGDGGFVAHPTTVIAELSNLALNPIDEFFVTTGTYKIRATYNLPSGPVVYLSPMFLVDTQEDIEGVQIVNDVMSGLGLTAKADSNIIRVTVFKREFTTTHQNGELATMGNLLRMDHKQIKPETHPGIKKTTVHAMLDRTISNISRYDNLVIGN